MEIVHKHDSNTHVGKQFIQHDGVVCFDIRNVKLIDFCFPTYETFSNMRFTACLSLQFNCVFLLKLRKFMFSS